MNKILMTLMFMCSSTLWAAGYGSGGCGGGSVLFGSGDGFSQVFAATTNGSSFSKYFGLSSGTSNCAEDGVVMTDKEKEFFTEANFESLMQEMAQGEGEYLFTFANLHGCYGENASKFSRLLRENYVEATVRTEDYESGNLLDNVNVIMKQNDLSCHSL